MAFDPIFIEIKWITSIMCLFTTQLKIRVSIFRKKTKKQNKPTKQTNQNQPHKPKQTKKTPKFTPEKTSLGFDPAII